MRPNTSINIPATSAAVNTSGQVIPADFVLYASAQITVTGTSTGSLSIQASNDIAPPVDTNGKPVPTNWTNIGTNQTLAISSSGTFLIPQFNSCYKWIRALFTASNAQTGTIQVTIQTIGF